MLSTRLADALRWAQSMHGDQVRKGTTIPYLSHPLAVAGLVLEDGGDETQAIAGLLHDTIEDTDATAADVERSFGTEVARIVEACTDAHTQSKPPWRPRKEAHLGRLEALGADEAVLRVTAADKLHNLTAILADHAEIGDALWARFNAGPRDQLWYHREVSALVTERLATPLARRYARAVEQLGRVVGAPAAGHGDID